MAPLGAVNTLFFDAGNASATALIGWWKPLIRTCLIDASDLLWPLGWGLELELKSGTVSS